MDTIVHDAEVEQDFSKAFNKALIHEIQHMLNPDEASLISFSDIKKLLKPQNESYEGVKTVPVNAIIGSEDRYKDFDSDFFPKSLHLKSRWKRIDSAHRNNIILPPISLYEVAGVYFVRDGNHRVSVAKASGVEFIDAEIVSLKSEIKLKPGRSLAYMVKQVITYEKRVFYSETNFGDVTDYWCLDFSTTGQYDVIYNHILTHKYYINMKQDTEISMQDAILSWFKTVYIPIIHVIEQKHIMRKFRKRTKSDMYVWLIKYWDELKHKFGSDYSLDKVATDFSREFGTGILKHFLNVLERFILKKNTVNRFHP